MNKQLKLLSIKTIHDYFVQLCLALSASILITTDVTAAPYSLYNNVIHEGDAYLEITFHHVFVAKALELSPGPYSPTNPPSGIFLITDGLRGADGLPKLTKNKKVYLFWTPFGAGVPSIFKYLDGTVSANRQIESDECSMSLVIEKYAIGEKIAAGDELIFFTQLKEVDQEGLLLQLIFKIFPKLNNFFPQPESELSGRHFFDASNPNYLVRTAFKNTPHNRNIVKKHLVKSDRSRNIQEFIGLILFYFWVITLLALLKGVKTTQSKVKSIYFVNTFLAPFYLFLLFVIYETGNKTGGIRFDILQIIPSAIFTLIISAIALVMQIRLCLQLRETSKPPL